ncbi:hypothetical protein ACIQXD_32345 [Streptomyces uncialis]|uniref:hypothetical protein n=1 Tax=Streptomyces uncialis TaxID=1048205 RepID=UPI003804F1F9
MTRAAASRPCHVLGQLWRTTVPRPGLTRPGPSGDEAVGAGVRDGVLRVGGERPLTR